MKKIVPIIIPDVYKLKFKTLKTKTNLNSLVQNLEQIKDLEQLYHDYITKTPPWIQEEQLSDLLKIRYIIQFGALKALYKNGDASVEELEGILITLTELIKNKPISVDNEIEIAVKDLLSKVQDNIATIGKNKREQDLSELLTEAQAIKKEAATESDLEILIAKLEEYQNEYFSAQEEINNLNKYLNVVKEKKIISELNSHFNEIKNEFTSDTWDFSRAEAIRESLALNRDLSSEIAVMKNELEQLIFRKQLKNKFEEMQEKFKNVDIFSTEISLQMLSMLKADVAYLILETESGAIGVEEEKEKSNLLLKEIQNKQSAIEKEIIKNSKQAVSGYNTWALNVIEDARQSFNTYEDQDGGFLGNKAKYHNNLISLFKSLLEIETNELYEPIRDVYYNLYNDVMSQLEPKEKYVVANMALSIKKKNSK